MKKRSRIPDNEELEWLFRQYQFERGSILNTTATDNHIRSAVWTAYKTLDNAVRLSKQHTKDETLSGLSKELERHRDEFSRKAAEGVTKENRETVVRKFDEVEEDIKTAIGWNE